MAENFPHAHSTSAHVKSNHQSSGGYTEQHVEHRNMIAKGAAAIAYSSTYVPRHVRTDVPVSHDRMSHSLDDGVVLPLLPPLVELFTSCTASAFFLAKSRTAGAIGFSVQGQYCRVCS